jgi:hypothetical protein
MSDYDWHFSLAAIADHFRGTNRAKVIDCPMCLQSCLDLAAHIEQVTRERDAERKVSAAAQAYVNATYALGSVLIGPEEVAFRDMEVALAAAREAT